MNNLSIQVFSSNQIAENVIVIYRDNKELFKFKHYLYFILENNSTSKFKLLFLDDPEVKSNLIIHNIKEHELLEIFKLNEWKLNL